MSANLFLLLVVVLVVTMIFARRLRFPFAELALLAVLALTLWLGLTEGRTRLLVVAPLVPLPLFGFRIPFVSDGGGRRSKENPRFTGSDSKVAEPARYVAGLLASRWPRGELQLLDSQLRFVTDGDHELFRVHLALIEEVWFSSLGRAHLTVEMQDGSLHAVAFGHQSLNRHDAGQAQAFWREVIEARGARPDP
jgi:hypothetical protein